MKTAYDAAKYLGNESVRLAEIAAKWDDTPNAGSPMQRALILRSEHMMDCARMIKDWVEGA